jgi:hypothetical protein
VVQVDVVSIRVCSYTAQVVATPEGGHALALHVDIVKNDWLRGTQVRVGVLVVDDDAVDFHGHDERVREVALRPVTDRETGEVVHVQKEPERFARLLHTAMGGSRLFATPPYEDPSESAFQEGDVLSMKTVAV